MQQSPVYPIQLSLLNFTEESRPKLQEYICPLCKGIYIDPVIDSCAHIFCKKCFVLYLSNQRKENKEQIICPLGNIPLNLSKIKDFDFISDIIKNQKIYCNNKDKGCQWIGLYELIQGLKDVALTELPFNVVAEGQMKTNVKKSVDYDFVMSLLRNTKLDLKTIDNGCQYGKCWR